MTTNELINPIGKVALYTPKEAETRFYRDGILCKVIDTRKHWFRGLQVEIQFGLGGSRWVARKEIALMPLYEKQAKEVFEAYKKLSDAITFLGKGFYGL
jgi:hypothetical protein